MSAFSVFAYDRLLLHEPAPGTLRVIGESATATDTWNNHHGGDAYSVAYVNAIAACETMIVDYKSLSSFDVVDRANFVPNLTSLDLSDCTVLTSANITLFGNLVALSIANTPLTNSIFQSLPTDKELRLVDVSNTRNITHVPSAQTVVAGHSLVTNIDPALAPLERLVANDARITSLQVTDVASAIMWSYAGKNLTVSGSSANLTVFTPQESTSVVAPGAHVIEISYYSI